MKHVHLELDMEDVALVVHDVGQLMAVGLNENQLAMVRVMLSTHFHLGVKYGARAAGVQAEVIFLEDGKRAIQLGDPKKGN
jgi:hypothetical protein